MDSWDRNNTILVNLLRAVPEGGLEARAVEGSMTVAEMFLHIHGTRLFLISEDAPEFAAEPLKQGWRETTRSGSHRRDAERQRTCGCARR